MLEVRKMNFSKTDLEIMRNELDGYIWLVMDIKKNIMAAGDEYVGKMKSALLKQKCLIQNIYGVGFDLDTREIDYCSPANVKIMDKNPAQEVPKGIRARVETLVEYFFLELL